MTIYHTFKVRKKTTINFDIIMVEEFMKLIRFWKCLPKGLKNFLPIFVETVA